MQPTLTSRLLRPRWALVHNTILAGDKTLVVILLITAGALLGLTSTSLWFEREAGRLDAQLRQAEARTFIAEQVLKTIEHGDLLIHRMLPSWNAGAYSKSLQNIERIGAALTGYREAAVRGGKVKSAGTAVPVPGPESKDTDGHANISIQAAPADSAWLKEITGPVDSFNSEVTPLVQQLVHALSVRDECFKQRSDCLPGAIDSIRGIARQFVPLLNSAYAPLHALINQSRLEETTLRQHTEGVRDSLLNARNAIGAGLIVAPLTIIAHLLINIRRSRKMLEEISMRESDASQAKSRFVAAVTHEIRTPLNAILGSTQLILETPLSDSQSALMRNVAESSSTLLDVVNGVLDLSRIEAGAMIVEPAVIDVRRLLQSVMTILNPRAEAKQLTIRIEAPANLQSVLGDMTLIRRVLLNLGGNAVKFTERGGIILRVEKLNSGIRFEVQDTGIGIPEHFRSNVFERFAQADSARDRRYGGTGLGLHLCREMVLHMGGTIGYRSEVGTGSLFWFELPLPDAQKAEGSRTDAERSAQAIEKSPLPGNTHVLVVDDTPSNLLVTTRLLESLGCRVDAVSSGEAAIAAAGRRRYSIIFMDMQMPGMDGLQSTRAIIAAATPPDRPLIIGLTANATPEDRQSCSDAGMCDYITKPADRNKLAWHIHRWLGMTTHPS